MLALLGQLTPGAESPAADARRVAATLRARPEAEIAVFPELFLGGYRLRNPGAIACDLGGEELATIAAACAEARTAALVGFVESGPLGFHDSVACIDERGELVVAYRKVQLFGEEAASYRPGKWLEVVELAGRKVAPLVCFDVEFPELARAAAMAGADLLVTCAANMEPFAAEHRLHARARALENRVPHLYVNRVGSEEGMRFVGGSCAIDTDGTVLRAAEDDGEEIFLVEVGGAGAADARVDYLSFEPTRMPVEVRSKSPVKGGAR
ncbi:MAG TPA: nitrilase-related carbon-nitrogen hydrolase [Solirubrobacterales bacterium]|nr:nitrilase-related carbon-nitrogen hydrolase [Solirubrobacterales bacterium]